MKYFNQKTKTYLVLGLAAVLCVIHTWYPITLSPTNTGDRTMFMFIGLCFIAAARAGMASARIAMGSTFIFCSAINLLIAIFYNVSNGIGNFIGILFWGLTLGLLGLALLTWKEVRFFEEKSLIQNAHSI